MIASLRVEVFADDPHQEDRNNIGENDGIDATGGPSSPHSDLQQRAGR